MAAVVRGSNRARTAVGRARTAVVRTRRTTEALGINVLATIIRGNNRARAAVVGTTEARSRAVVGRRSIVTRRIVSTRAKALIWELDRHFRARMEDLLGG